MPLHEGAKPGSKEFGENVATEEKAGKPEKQAVAIAYSESGEKKSDGEMLMDAVSELAGRVEVCDAKTPVVYVPIWSEGSAWFWKAPSSKRHGPFNTGPLAEDDLRDAGYYPRY